MSKIIIDVPDTVDTRSTNAIAKATGYPSDVPNPAFNPSLPIDATNSPTISNPVGKKQWIKNLIINQLKMWVKQGEAIDITTAKQQAIAQNDADIDANLNLT